MADFEKRFELKTRNSISTGWAPIDEITQGGLGKGELGVGIASTGAGKSFALVHLGAQALKAGKTVVHYTLELSDTVIATRYDSCLTGVHLGEHRQFKEMIYDKIQDIPGKLIIKECFYNAVADRYVNSNRLVFVVSSKQCLHREICILHNM